MEYDPMQLDLLMKMVASTLGPRLQGLTIYFWFTSIMVFLYLFD